MSGVDITICILILIGGISGYREGFLMSLFSFLALVLGVLGAFKLMGWVMLFLADHFNVDQKVLPYVAFAVIFVAIVVSVQLLGRMIRLSLDKSFLGRVDQLAGGVLGLFKTAFMLSVLLWIIDSFRYHLPQKWTDNSWVLPRVADFAPGVTKWIGEFIPFFKDIF